MMAMAGTLIGSQQKTARKREIPGMPQRSAALYCCFYDVTPAIAANSCASAAPTVLCPRLPSKRCVRDAQNYFQCAIYALILRSGEQTLGISCVSRPKLGKWHQWLGFQRFIALRLEDPRHQAQSRPARPRNPCIFWRERHRAIQSTRRQRRQSEAP